MALSKEEKRGFLLKTDLQIEAEQGYAGRFHLLACTHLQEITVPAQKERVPGLNAWAGQVSEEWNSHVAEVEWRANL